MIDEAEALRLWRAQANRLDKLVRDQSTRVTHLATERARGPRVHHELVCRERLALRRREMEGEGWRWVGSNVVVGTKLLTAAWWRY